MNPCKDCIVDMICIKECPIFEVDLDRLKTDEELYLKRCMNNSKNETYNLSNNIQVEICEDYIWWYKNGKIHRDNDKPATIYYNGCKYWYKDGEQHRDNDQPVATWIDGTQSWYTNGVQYEPM